MKVYFVRHGETDWNKTGRLQGRTNIPLNENGRYVAELTRDALSNVQFDVAISSPLIRAKETAQILLEGRDVVLKEDERIIEINFGEYEGTAKKDADECIQKFFKAPGEYQAVRGAESLESLFQRAEEFLKELFYNQDYQNSTIMVTAHGAIINALICVIKGYEVAELWKDGLHGNCGVTIVDVECGRPKILKQGILLYASKLGVKFSWIDKKTEGEKKNDPL